jgi:hypothetical protein
MTTRTTIEDDVVALLDIIAPARLAAMPAQQRNSYRLITINNFDEPTRIVLCMPLGDIAGKHGGGKARLIASAETATLANVGEAIELTTRAAKGEP